jgi:hypothetical protein
MLSGVLRDMDSWIFAVGGRSVTAITSCPSELSVEYRVPYVCVRVHCLLLNIKF